MSDGQFFETIREGSAIVSMTFLERASVLAAFPARRSRRDQVSGFNTALSEYSASREPRLIDGIMLTKFDTISDKVGAALSLVYTTGKPIVFVGTGQTYLDIRNLNVEHVVKALLR